MRSLSIILFVITLVLGTAYYMPFSMLAGFVDNQQQTLAWTDARGRIHHGQLLNVTYASKPVGNVSAKLRPVSLLSASPAYDINFNGAGGKARGKLNLSHQTLKISDTRAEIALSSIEQIDARLRAIGGAINVRSATFALNQQGCVSAGGSVTTDVAKRFGQTYERSWPDLTGQIRCEGGQIILPLEGTGAAGERFNLMMKMSPTMPLSLTADISGIDPEVEIALVTLGFVYRDGRYHFSQTIENTQIGGSR